MFLLGFRRKLTALALCKLIESAIQWFQMHHRITFATRQNPAVYLSGARVSIFSTFVPRLIFVYKSRYHIASVKNEYDENVKGVKKVRSAIKLCSYYFSYYVSNDIQATGILKVDTLDKQ